MAHCWRSSSVKAQQALAWPFLLLYRSTASLVQTAPNDASGLSDVSGDGRPDLAALPGFVTFMAMLSRDAEQVTESAYCANAGQDTRPSLAGVFSVQRYGALTKGSGQLCAALTTPVVRMGSSTANELAANCSTSPVAL